MGRRQLLVSGDLLVELVKERSRMRRTFSIANALPDDVQVVDYLLKTNGVIALVLESAEWVGQSEIPLEQPVFRVHYEEDATR